MLDDLGFCQVDDYFRTRSGAVWLYPCVGGRVVDHHEGPYDAIRLGFCVLRNPSSAVDELGAVINAISELSGVEPIYLEAGRSLGLPPDLGPLVEDIHAVIAHWRDEGVEPGSADASDIDF